MGILAWHVPDREMLYLISIGYAENAENNQLQQ